MRKFTKLLLLVVMILSIGTSTFAKEYKATDGVYDKLKSITFDDMAYKPVNHWSSVAVYTVAAAGLIKSWSGIRSSVVAYLVICLVSTVITMVVSGHTTQLIMRIKNKGGTKK